MRFTMSARYAVEVQPFQSTESTRYYLNGFYVHQNPSGGLRIVATDGHRMAVFHDAAGSAEIPADTSPGGFIVSLPKAALAAIRQERKDFSDALLRLVISDENGPKGEARLVLCHDPEKPETLASWHGVIVDGTFPDYERTVPQAADFGNKHSRAFCFNARYLADFGKLNPGKGECVDVTRTSDAESPHLVFVPGRHDFFGVIMPVRGECRTITPLWFRDGPPAPKGKEKPAEPASVPLLTGKALLEAAAQWGSLIHNSDPGACLYGFSPDGLVQHEEHRASCLSYIDSLLADKSDAEETADLRLLRASIAAAPVAAAPEPVTGDLP